MDTELISRALFAADTKLRLYRQAHGAEYVGGMEFTALLKLLDEAHRELEESSAKTVAP